MLSTLSITGYAQTLLDTLIDNQNQIPARANSTSSTSPEIKPEPVAKPRTSGACNENEQTSLPLKYLTALILEKDGGLEIQHDSRSGKLTVKSGDMIGNCSSMIDWVPNARIVDGKKIYSIEAKIKKSSNCEGKSCVYSVATVEKKQFKIFEDMSFEPNMKGFEECLKQSGVVKEGKVVADAIYPSAISEKFEGYKESGEVVFVSHGPSSKLMKPRYDENFTEIDQCDHYERIVKDGLSIKSLGQEEDDRIYAEKKEVIDCKEYNKISDFMERYQGFSGELSAIRDNLILEAVEAASKAVLAGEYTEENLKTIADFEKYIIQPRIKLASDLYAEAEGLKGDEKTTKLAEMKNVLTKLKEYNNTPYISSVLVKKLETDGRFSEAAMADGIKSIIVNHAGLGRKESGIVITPKVALARTIKQKEAYALELEDKKEKYEVRTGQTTGQAKGNAEMASRMRENIQTRSQNFSQEIQEEYARTQPGGYCYKNPFRNVQKCIAKSMERIQELQAQLQHFNKVDAERAGEYDEKSAEYSKLEKEGRDYVARQNGDAVDKEDEVIDYTVPTPRNEEGYAFNFQGYGQQQQQQQNQQQGQQQQYNPYQQYMNPMQQQYNPYGQQQNFMGQQNYANFGQQQQYNPYGPQQQYNPYQQQQQAPQQQGFWSNPYQAYGNYNMYGGYR